MLGVPSGVHRHQERAVGVAPQVQLVEAQRGPHGVDVVGGGGRPVEAAARSQIGAAERGEVPLVKRQRILGGLAGRAAQRARLPGPAHIDQQQVAARAQRRERAGYRPAAAIVDPPGPPILGTIVPSAGRLVSVCGTSA